MNMTMSNWIYLAAGTAVALAILYFGGVCSDHSQTHDGNPSSSSESSSNESDSSDQDPLAKYRYEEEAKHLSSLTEDSEIKWNVNESEAVTFCQDSEFWTSLFKTAVKGTNGYEYKEPVCELVLKTLSSHDDDIKVKVIEAIFKAELADDLLFPRYKFGVQEDIAGRQSGKAIEGYFFFERASKYLGHRLIKGFWDSIAQSELPTFSNKLQTFEKSVKTPKEWWQDYQNLSDKIEKKKQAWNSFFGLKKLETTIKEQYTRRIDELTDALLTDVKQISEPDTLLTRMLRAVVKAFDNTPFWHTDEQRKEFLELLFFTGCVKGSLSGAQDPFWNVHDWNIEIVPTLLRNWSYNRSEWSEMKLKKTNYVANGSLLEPSNPNLQRNLEHLEMTEPFMGYQ